jgi:hypothetical protein
MPSKFMVSVIVASTLIAAAPAWSADRPATPATHPAITPPTADLAQSEFDSGHYTEAMPTIARLLALDPVKAQYDRQAMLMLRADCQLHLKQYTAAADTLNAVRLAAEKANDQPTADRAIAMLHLIQKSPGGFYTPATGADKKPLNILDASHRKTAYAALYADQFALLQQKVTAAKNTATLPLILEIAASARGLRALATTADKSARDIDDATKDLPAAANTALRRALADGDQTVSRISRSANAWVRVQTGATIDVFNRASTNYTERKTGLSTADATALREVETSCDHLPDIITTLTQAFGKPETYRILPKRFADLKSRADTVLKADYSHL